MRELILIFKMNVGLCFRVFDMEFFLILLNLVFHLSNSICANKNIFKISQTRLNEAYEANPYVGGKIKLQ